jgi:phosphinothricin acetyltransferase
VRPSTAPVAIAALVASDWDDVGGIHADGIVSGLATFETEVPTWLARDAGRAVGWAALALLAALVESSEASVRMHERRRAAVD